MTTYNPGDKVSYDGTTYIVRRAADARDIEKNASRVGSLFIVPARRDRYGSNFARFVSPSKLQPYEPKSKVSKHAKTCQICGRAIHAATGTIAHHGYTRPTGRGFQTASCYGARHLPFEVSRDTLGDFLVHVTRDVASAAATVQKFIDDRVTGVPGPEEYKMDEATGRVLRDKNGSAVRHRPMIHKDHAKWSHFLRIARGNAENEHKHLADYLAMQQNRFDTWKPVAEKGGSK